MIRKILLAASIALGIYSTTAIAQTPNGTLRVALSSDVLTFDPQHFQNQNFPFIKNLYDSLIEYTPEGNAIPSLATSWNIASDNTSVTVNLRRGVKFHNGIVLTANDVAATLKKAADPKTGRNVFATMAIVKNWVVIDSSTIRLNFAHPVPEKQITDLLQFISPIEENSIDTIETKPIGTGAFILAERMLGQRVKLVANPNYWRNNEPKLKEIVFTVFGDNASANAALETNAVDMIYGGDARSAIRLRNDGYQLIQGPGPLVQTFRLNPTRGPFRNEKFRQAFTYLMDRNAILQAGYAGLGTVTTLPWAPASPAADKTYDVKYGYNLDKARALIKESGLSAAEMNDWKILVKGEDPAAVTISQIVQNTLTKVGIKVGFELKTNAEYADAQVNGKFDATFGGIGNIQKFPTRVGTNSIYRPSKNPVFGDPHPFPKYVAGIEAINKTFDPALVKSAYDNLNRVLIESAFAIPTNTYDLGLIVASKNVIGISREIDNMLVGRTISIK